MRLLRNDVIVRCSPFMLLPVLFACGDDGGTGTGGASANASSSSIAGSTSTSGAGGGSSSTGQTTSTSTGGEGGGSETRTVVGPEGGTVEADGVTLVVPPGALDSEVELTISIDGTPPDPIAALSSRFAFEPHGLTFLLPVELRFSIASAVNPVVRWSDDGSTYQSLETTHLDGEAIASVDHFSWGHVEEAPAGCTISVVEQFDTADVVGEQGGWNLVGSQSAPGFESDLTLSWNDGSDGHRFDDGHILFECGGAGNAPGGVGLISPLLEASGCEGVELEFLHEIATLSSVSEDGVMRAEIRVVPDGVNILDGTLVHDHAPSTQLGEVAPVLHDLTPHLPATGPFRVWFWSTVTTYGETAFWVIDDVQIRGF